MGWDGKDLGNITITVLGAIQMGPKLRKSACFIEERYEYKGNGNKYYLDCDLLYSVSAYP